MTKRGGVIFWCPRAWRQFPSLLACDEKGRVFRVPGVWAEDDYLYVPANAATVVAGLMEQMGKTPMVQHQPPKRIRAGKSAVLNERAQQFLRDTPYQQKAVEFTRGKEGSMIVSSPGSGKSLMAVAAACEAGLPAAVITGAKGRLKLASEIAKFTGRKAYILRGAEKKEIVRYDPDRGKVDGGYDPRAVNELAKDSGFVVTAWQTLPAWKNELMALRPVKAILDESHTAQGRKRSELSDEYDICTTCRAKVERKFHQESPELDAKFTWEDELGGDHTNHQIEHKEEFIKLETVSACAAEVCKKAGSRLATTGTPIPDRPRGLWSQLDLLEPWEWGSSPWWFAHAYCGSRMDGGDDKGATNLPELYERMSDVVLQIPYELTHRDLPPLRVETLRLTPDELSRPIGSWADELRRNRRDGEKLLESLLERSASRKAPKVLELVQEAVFAGQKAVVFSARRNDVERLGKIIRAGVPESCPVWVAHGETPEPERFHIAEHLYQPHPGPAVLVGTGYAFGEQIDLHDTDVAIMAMLPWRPGDLKQWMLRFQRKGGKRACRLFFLIAEGDIGDERVARVLLDKVPPIFRLTGDTFAQEMADVIEGVKGHEQELLDGLADMILGAA